MATAANQLWVPTPEDKKNDPMRTVWELASLRSWGADGTSAVVMVGGRELTVQLCNCHSYDPSHAVDFDDAGTMGDLHEAPLIKLLKRRHQADTIYTWSGHGVLISINPYRLIPGLYNMARVQDAIQRSVVHTAPDANAEEEEAALPPHIYSVADIAYNAIGSTGNAQVLVVNGESGAGKTEACRQLMRYIACASSETRRTRSAGQERWTIGPDGRKRRRRKKISEGGADSPLSPSSPARALGEPSSPSQLSVSQVEEYMLQASPVLEAFGNAKTIRNNNSSRFGKFTWLLFSADATLQGSRIETFLLEKARLTVQAKQERNFHAFYMLCAVAARDSNLPAVKQAGDYLLLSHGSCEKVAAIDDTASFAEVVEAMACLGFADELGEVWRLLSALLELGNLDFISDDGDDGDNNSFGGCRVTDEAQLRKCAEQLGCQAGHLRDALLERTFEVGLQSFSKTERTSRKTSIRHTTAEAGEARDALIKHVYGVLFLWLVALINRRSAPGSPDPPPRKAPSPPPAPAAPVDRWAPRVVPPVAAPAAAAPGRWDGPQLGLLDIYGFENLEANSLEQLCINYANEIMQKQFNERIFVLERAMYATEGIEIDEVIFRDFSGVIELLSGKPTGIFALLEEQGRLGERGTDKTFTLTLFNYHFGKNAHLGKPRVGQRLEGEGFTIDHFAGEITYDTAGFLKKNVDELNVDLQTLLNTQVGGLVARIRSELNLGGPPGGDGADGSSSIPQAPARRNSVKGMDNLTIKFQSQMRDLMALLQESEPRWVRCIKPNAAQAPAVFEEPLVCNQLRYLGVMETVRIRRAGYPVKCPFGQIVRDFSELHIPGWSRDQSDERDLCIQLLTAHLAPKLWRIGYTQLFMADGAMATLRARVAEVRFEKAAKLQAHARRKRDTRRVEVLRQARIAEWRRVAATRLQAAARRKGANLAVQARRRAARNMRSVIAIQSIRRGLVVRRATARYVASREETALLIEIEVRVLAAMCVEQAIAEERARLQRIADELWAAGCIQRYSRGRSVRRTWGNILRMWLKVHHVGHEAFERLQDKVLEDGETIRLASVVKRLDQGFLGSQIQVGPVPLHQLVFFAAADPRGVWKGTRLLCFDEALTVINWEMQWSEATKVTVKEREFTISDRSGKGKFADMLGDASRWKDEVESFGGGLRPDSPAKTSRPPSVRGTPDKAPRPMGDLRSCAPTSMPNILDGLPMMPPIAVTAHRAQSFALHQQGPQHSSVNNPAPPPPPPPNFRGNFPPPPSAPPMGPAAQLAQAQAEMAKAVADGDFERCIVLREKVKSIKLAMSSRELD